MANKWIGVGRLTGDPEIRWTAGENPTCIARYRVAVPRRMARSETEQDTDFLPCVAFGKQGEFAEKYLKKGTKVIITGRLQSGSYTDKDGKRVFTLDVVVEDQEFAESKAVASGSASGENKPATATEKPEQVQAKPSTSTDGFMTIPEGAVIGLPWAP